MDGRSGDRATDPDVGTRADFAHGAGVIDGIEVELGTDPNNSLDFPLLPMHALPLLGVVLGVVAIVSAHVRRRGKRFGCF